MDINEQTSKIGSNPLLRYTALLIGLCILFLSEGILTWKKTAAREASGDIAAIQFKIGKLQKQIKDTDDADEKKDLRESIEKLKEDDLEDARMEAASEEVDAQNGIWFWSMARLKGAAIIAVGLLIVAATGGAHEKVGALVALGLVAARL